MSEQTKAALEAAIAAHINDEADGELRLLTVSEEADVTCYLHVCSNNGTHVLLGLVDIAKRRLVAHFEDAD